MREDKFETDKILSRSMQALPADEDLSASIPLFSLVILCGYQWDIRDAQGARGALKNLHIGGRLVEVQYSKTQNDKVKERNTVRKEADTID